MKGFVNSIQSMGTLDGPGVRFVVFLQGCNLRCGCCHNPETWVVGAGTEFAPEEIVSRCERFKEYFGDLGGITLTGGEPLLQAKFAGEIFALCREKGINTCLDTSGSVMNDEVSKLLDLTDYVLLDIKYTNEEQYKKYAGCSIQRPLDFLKILSEKNIPTVLRQVIIPTLNDTEENILRLKGIAEEYKNVEKIELLPFKKICTVKYEKEGKKFPFADIPTPTPDKMKELNNLL